MGFYFKKSISFGGIRFNFSKSGIGVSAGFKGFRIGTGPKGNYVHIGANGLYYRSSIGTQRNGRKVQPELPSEVTKVNNEELNYVNIESSDVGQIVDSSSSELINEVSSKLKKIPFWPFGLLLAYINPAIALLAAFILYQIDIYRKTTIILYDIDEDSETKLQSFYDSFDELKDCQMTWHLHAAAQTQDYKHNAGAGTLVKRNAINISNKVPKYMKTNVNIPCIPVGKRKLYFFPDRIFIYDGNKVGALSYSSLQIDQHNQRFKRTELSLGTVKLLTPPGSMLIRTAVLIKDFQTIKNFLFYYIPSFYSEVIRA